MTIEPTTLGSDRHPHCVRDDNTKFHSPPIMCEGFVGFGHAMDIFLFLHRRATSICGIEQLICELVDHSLLSTGTAIAHEPSDSKRGAAIGIHLDRHLV